MSQFFRVSFAFCFFLWRQRGRVLINDILLVLYKRSLQGGDRFIIESIDMINWKEWYGGGHSFHYFFYSNVLERIFKGLEERLPIKTDILG